MTALLSILDRYRTTSQTEREKGSYFEELIRSYLALPGPFRVGGSGFGNVAGPRKGGDRA